MDVTFCAVDKPIMPFNVASHCDNFNESSVPMSFCQNCFYISSEGVVQGDDRRFREVGAVFEVCVVGGV